MSERHDELRRRRVNRALLGIMLAIGAVPATASAGLTFTWDPAEASPSLIGDPEITADTIQATHYLYDLGSSTNIYTVNFLEQITGFTLDGVPVATPGLNGTPGATGSYSMYLTMQTQTLSPSSSIHHYLSGSAALMLDPGNNDGAPSSTLSGLMFANVGPISDAHDITLATGSLVSGHFSAIGGPLILSIGDFVQTFQPAAGEGGFFVTPVSPYETIQLIDTTFTGDLITTADPSASDPTRTIGVLNGGSSTLDLHVPEPASLALLGSALGALMLVRRRRTRSD